MHLLHGTTVKQFSISTTFNFLMWPVSMAHNILHACRETLYNFGSMQGPLEAVIILSETLLFFAFGASLAFFIWSTPEGIWTQGQPEVLGLVLTISLTLVVAAICLI